MSDQWRNRITGHGEEAPDQLLANPRNWRVHPKAQQDALAAVLDQVGWVQDVIVNQRTGHVVDGHARIALAISREEPSIPVVYVDLDEEEERLILASLDPLSAMATTDHDAMRALLAEISVDDDALLAMFEKVSPGRKNGGNSDPDAVPDVPEQSYVQRGEVYQLGSHRLMCGDSTDAADVARLMGDERAALLATDPPYLVDYQGGNHPQSWANSPTTRDKHWDDYRDPDAATGFFADFLKAWLPHCVEGVPVYQWHATRRQTLVEAAWRESGLLVHQTIVWVKSRPVLTRSDFMWQHEPCFYGWPQGHRPAKKPPANVSTVWEINQQGEQDGIHPTQKPVEIFGRPIQYHTTPGAICAEPFSGSGSQIIAAEQQGRRCFAMELEPKFAHMAAVRERLAPGGDDPRVVHWSPAEVSNFETAYNSAKARHPDRTWGSPRWFDFLRRVMQEEPVVVRGAMAFGLKAVAKALHGHGFIETLWGDGPADGLGAMVGAWWSYEAAQQTATRLNEVDLMQQIIAYNEVDCRVMWEAVRYLRQSH